MNFPPTDRLPVARHENRGQHSHLRNQCEVVNLCVVERTVDLRDHPLHVSNRFEPRGGAQAMLLTTAQACAGVTLY